MSVFRHHNYWLHAPVCNLEQVKMRYHIPHIFLIPYASGWRLNGVSSYSLCLSHSHAPGWRLTGVRTGVGGAVNGVRTGVDRAVNRGRKTLQGSKNGGCLRTEKQDQRDQKARFFGRSLRVHASGDRLTHLSTHYRLSCHPQNSLSDLPTRNPNPPCRRLTPPTTERTMKSRSTRIKLRRNLEQELTLGTPPKTGIARETPNR